jgi:secreted trypsin-like serine protease
MRKLSVLTLVILCLAVLALGSGPFQTAQAIHSATPAASSTPKLVPPSTPVPRQTQETNRLASPEIVGGTVVNPPGLYPWQVYILTSNTGKFCGGSIIADYWILTAAHCVLGKSADEVVVIAGVHNLATPEPDYQRLHVAQIIVHTGYVDVDPFPNDIGLLKLASPVPIRTSPGLPISTISLVQNEQLISVGTTVTITGWGNLRFYETSDPSYYPSSSLSERRLLIQLDGTLAV